MQFDLSFTKENLGRVYGVPPDLEKLAYDVHRMIEQTELFPIDFKVLGKFFKYYINIPVKYISTVNSPIQMCKILKSKCFVWPLFLDLQ